jgi:hypothetical protein
MWMAGSVFRCHCQAKLNPAPSKADAPSAAYAAVAAVVGSPVRILGIHSC